MECYMFPKQQIKTYVIGNDNLCAKVLESGNIQEIRSGINRINTYVLICCFGNI